MGAETPQVLMDPPSFVLAPLLITDVEYQLWRNGIPYAQQLMDDLDYEEFSETWLMPSFPIEVCIFSLSSFFSLYLWNSACDDIQMWWSCQVVGGPVDPPHLPWSVYTYGPDGFIWECFLGHNLNFMGYHFTLNTRAVISLYPWPSSLSFFLLHPRACLNIVFVSNLAHGAQRACLACWEP